MEGTARTAIMIREFRAPHYGMKPFYRAVGFCDTVMVKQSPLSAAETSALPGH